MSHATGGKERKAKPLSRAEAQRRRERQVKKSKNMSHAKLAEDAEKGKDKDIPHAKPQRTQREAKKEKQKHDLAQRRRDAEKGKKSVSRPQSLNP
jgi:hypothetical protein